MMPRANQNQTLKVHLAKTSSLKLLAKAKINERCSLECSLNCLLSSQCFSKILMTAKFIPSKTHKSVLKSTMIPIYSFN